MRQVDKTPSPAKLAREKLEADFIEELTALEKKYQLLIDTVDEEGMTLISKEEWDKRRENED